MKILKLDDEKLGQLQSLIGEVPFKYASPLVAFLNGNIRDEGQEKGGERRKPFAPKDPDERG